MSDGQLEEYQRLLRFDGVATPQLQQAAFDPKPTAHQRVQMANDMRQAWEKSFWALVNALPHQLSHDTNRALTPAYRTLKAWASFAARDRSQEPSARDTWERFVGRFREDLQQARSMQAELERFFAPDPPVEEWYALNIFGGRAITTLMNDSRNREEAKALAIRFRSAAVTAEIVAPGSSDENVYLAVRDWLVGVLGASPAKAECAPVARIIPLLKRSRPARDDHVDHLTNDELLFKFVMIVLQERSISATELAKKLGVTRSTLYKTSPRWLPIRRFLKSNNRELPEGFKNAEGLMDAWDSNPEADHD